jgi:hypothetical protein
MRIRGFLGCGGPRIGHDLFLGGDPPAARGLTADQLPRTILTVELDEGCRVLGRLVPGVDDPQLGPDLPVEAVFIDQDGWTELAFALVDRTAA